MKSRWTISPLSRKVVVQSGISHRKAIDTMFNADGKSSKSVIDRITAIHHPYGIYEECGHNHEPDEPGVTEVDDVGLVCAEGKIYEICVSCCMEGLSSTGQTETCASSHKHKLGEPICATMREITKDSDASYNEAVSQTHEITVPTYAKGALVYVPTRAWSVTSIVVDHIEDSEVGPIVVTSSGKRYPAAHASVSAQDIYEINLALIRKELETRDRELPEYLKKVAALHRGAYGNIEALRRARARQTHE